MAVNLISLSVWRLVVDGDGDKLEFTIDAVDTAMSISLDNDQVYDLYRELKKWLI
jgi:hypothetical protein